MNGREMSIERSHSQIGMPQEILDIPDINSTFKQMNGKGVP